jgi:hypothetical protein
MATNSEFFRIRSLFRYAYGIRVVPGPVLYGETLPALGPAAFDDIPARGGAHSLSEALRPFLLKVAFLRCCFRHRLAPSAVFLNRRVL